MLFSSYEFLLLFLPLTVVGFAVCRARSMNAAKNWLLFCSAVFYGFWGPRYLALLAGSIGVNFVFGRGLNALTPGSGRSRCLLAVGMLFNLGLLAWFKYASFLVDNAATLLGTDWALDPIVLPLAISFFTFQQLAFLVDAYRMRTPTGSLVEYALFVLFFPQLIAGPIVQHRDILPQFADERRLRLRWETVAVGITLFVAGLFKKVVLADSLAPTADAVFDAAAVGKMITFADAWLGTLAYTLQLYFDFSGYSDMAVGLGWLFGLRIPVNFNAPYQAANISDFWRRWHMTLSQFLRDYLYIPLGGSRCPTIRRSINLFLTMLLGGLWHGAGWTFIAWGALHGLLLVVNHAWQGLVRRSGWSWTETTSWRIAARTITLLAVIGGWVIFRAADLATTRSLLAGLCGFTADVPGTSLVDAALLAPVLMLLLAVQVLPTIQRLVPDADQPAGDAHAPRWLRAITWRPTAWHGAALSVALLVCLSLLTRVKEFLYFQF